MWSSAGNKVNTTGVPVHTSTRSLPFSLHSSFIIFTLEVSTTLGSFILPPPPSSPSLLLPLPSLLTGPEPGRTGWTTLSVPTVLVPRTDVTGKGLTGHRRQKRGQGRRPVLTNPSLLPVRPPPSPLSTTPASPRTDVPCHHDGEESEGLRIGPSAPEDPPGVPGTAVVDLVDLQEVTHTGRSTDSRFPPVGGSGRGPRDLHRGKGRGPTP